MAPTQQAPPDAAVECYVTQGIDGGHLVALRFTTIATSFVIALPLETARQLAVNIPPLLEAAAAEAEKLNKPAKTIVLPDTATTHQINHRRK